MKEIKVTEKELKRLLKRSIGYGVYTVCKTEKNSFWKIAIKKCPFKNQYMVMFVHCKKDNNGETKSAVATIKSTVELENSDVLVIPSMGKLRVHDACFSLTKPSTIIKTETDAYRRVSQAATQTEEKRLTAIFSEQISKTNAEMNDTRDKMEQDILKQKQYYTYGLVQRVKTLGHELFPFSCRRNEEKKSYSYTGEARKYLKTEYSNHEDTYKASINSLMFYFQYLDKNACGSNFTEDISSLDNLIKKARFKLEQLNTKYDENDLLSVLSLYGIIAAELKRIVFEMCDRMATGFIDYTLNLAYEETTLIDEWNNYMKEHVTGYETVRVDNVVNTIFEGAAIFIERVTGENIREEIKKRLGLSSKKSNK